MTGHEMVGIAPGVITPMRWDDPTETWVPIVQPAPSGCRAWGKRLAAKRPFGYRRSRDLPRPLYVPTGYCEWQTLAKLDRVRDEQWVCPRCRTVATLDTRSRETYERAAGELAYRLCPAQRRRVWPSDLRDIPAALRPDLGTPGLVSSYHAQQRLGSSDFVGWVGKKP